MKKLLIFAAALAVVLMIPATASATSNARVESRIENAVYSKYGYVSYAFCNRVRNTRHTDERWKCSLTVHKGPRVAYGWARAHVRFGVFNGRYHFGRWR